MWNLIYGSLSYSLVWIYGLKTKGLIGKVCISIIKIMTNICDDTWKNYSTFPEHQVSPILPCLQKPLSLPYLKLPSLRELP